MSRELAAATARQDRVKVREWFALQQRLVAERELATGTAAASKTGGFFDVQPAAGEAKEDASAALSAGPAVAEERSSAGQSHLDGGDDGLD